MRKAKKPDSQGAHIKRRMAATGQTYAETAKEFGLSKTTTHRRAKSAEANDDKDFLRKGFFKV
jgi:DNA invertase Pin-like site-specific DNA recombinase